MCGIAGIVDPGLPAEEIGRIASRMTATLRHRGPDDDGMLMEDGVGLGVRRLSIIDRAGGHQPIGNETGSVQVVFNGEIYNYQELRLVQEQRGHRFRTRSDTEAIAHAYEDHGSRCATGLCGMFAAAIWDRERRRLVLLRDRLGKKPLYYAVTGQRFLFGSEIKALIAGDPSLAEPDPDALIPYLRYGFVPEPGTMYRRILKLPAAHALVFDDGRATIEPYWRIEFDPEPDRRRPIASWREELGALVEESVRIRLRSEVPLGVFLSGGVDSSTVAAYAHRCGLRPLRTFTIGFDRPEWDETADAALVARHLGTEHQVLTLREAEVVRTLPETLRTLVAHFDEPFGDSSALPTFHVSRMARQHVTVILSGDGGDELFAGYSTYRGIRFAELYRRLPGVLSASILPSLADAAAAGLPRGWKYGAQRAARVLRDSLRPFDEMYFSKVRTCTDDVLAGLLTPDLAAQLPGLGEQVPADVLETMRSSLPALSRASYADIRVRLLDDMLVKVDRMSMANSLEVRSPLLDHRLVEFAARVPPELKLRRLRGKAILKDTVAPLLPARILRKRKQGFAVPLREWLRVGLGELVGDYLDSVSSPLPSALFNRSGVSELLRRHRAGEVDGSQAIWSLLSYAVWQDARDRRSGTRAEPCVSTSGQ